MGKKAEVSETVIDRHHHRAALRQRPAVIRRQPASAEGKSSAVQPDHHRKRIGACDWRPDVKVQAVFRELAGIAATQLLTAFAALPAGGGERRRRTYAIPARGRTRGAPPPLAYGRCRIGNAAPHVSIAFSKTNQCALARFNHRGGGIFHTNLLFPSHPCRVTVSEQTATLLLRASASS